MFISQPLPNRAAPLQTPHKGTTMFASIVAFETRYQLKNPVFWVCVILFFLFGFGLTASNNVSLGAPGAVHENSPYAITVALSIFSLFFLFVITALVANSVIRDDSTGFGPIIRSTSITRNGLLFGRFTGGFLVAILGYLALPLGMAFGILMPWVDSETIGPGGFIFYAWPFLIIAIPNIFLASALLFSLATMTRSMLGSYIGVIIFVMGYLVVTSILGPRPEYNDVMAKFEPLGIGAVTEASRYWAAAEMNSRLIPLTGNLLFNRTLAILLAIGFLGLAYARFSMTELAPSKWRLRKIAKTEAKQAKIAAIAPVLTGANIMPSHGGGSTSAQFIGRLIVEIKNVLKSPGLIVLLLLAAMNITASLWFSQTTYGTPSHPLAANIISTIAGNMSIFLLIVAVFYGGELVWRERDCKFNEIIDASPTASWTMFVPKILAILMVLLLMNIMGMVIGLLFQFFKGSNDIVIGQYLTWFILPRTIDMLLIAILAVAAQVVSPNKYVGWGIVFVWFIGSIFLSNLGYDNILYSYASVPSEPLSDMNGADRFWVGATWARLYWVSFAVLLLVIAHLLWPRGTVVALRPRLANIRRRVSALPLLIGAASLGAMIGSGMFIHYNIKQLNIYRTSDQQEKWSADYEKKYLKNEKLARPTLTDVTFNAQIFPKERKLEVIGQYRLRNETDQPISEVHIRHGDFEIQFPKLTLTGAKQASFDKEFGYRIFRFDKPLAPGATAALDFKSVLWRRGFKNGAPDVDLLTNGSFINNFAFAPIVGMDRNNVLQDRTQRRRQGLPAELRPAKLEDVTAQGQNYIHADWVNSDISVTTDADQTPIAPGNKVSDTTLNGRRTARFVSPAPILNFFAMQSARYAVQEQQYGDVNLSIYYHPAHKWNVPIMQKALATALDYYRTNFGPYQFNYARIIEFPGYQSFAQAFAGTMPYSESVGFAADVSDPESIDYVTYITAHELGHQYWAHQVVGADMQGGTMTSETLAQYSALMVMKKLYGPDKIRRFLKFELDSYLRSRKAEATEEVPLERVENQPYIHYRKGSLVMYLLQERLGEDAVNSALRRFLERFKFKGAPYHRSIDLVAEFRKEAKTPGQQALITDLFEKITIYDLKATEAKSVKGKDGLWTTTINVEAHKYYASGKGVETEAPLTEAIEVGLFTARPEAGTFAAKDVLSMERRPIKGGKQTIILTSKVKPVYAGIDPYNFYIDRDSDDNVVAL
jgi:ABC-2 type transport system permease protein